MSHSVFNIIGPAMIGPSSSHTAGAVRIGLVARHLFGVLRDIGRRMPRALKETSEAGRARVRTEIPSQRVLAKKMNLVV